MTTYLALRQRIVTELAMYDFTADQVNAAISTAIRKYERLPYWFNMNRGTFATVNAQEFYTLANMGMSTDLIDVMSLVCANFGSETQLLPVPNHVIDALRNGSTTGVPTHFSRHAESVRLYPTPNSNYTMTIRYTNKLAALSADSDTNAWTDECEELTRMTAKRILAQDILMNADMAKAFAELETVAFKSVAEEHNRRFPYMPISLGITPKVEG